MTVRVGDRHLEFATLALRGADHPDLGKLVDKAVGRVDPQLHGAHPKPFPGQASQPRPAARTSARAPTSALPLRVRGERPTDTPFALAMDDMRASGDARH
jgi:hypothetical protein